MNDFDLDPIHELASAYLDGELSADERARAEASAEVQAAVASLAALRTALADVTPAKDSAREAALAAAFAEFDSPTDAPVVPIRSRRRWSTRVMTAAAAVVLVGIVGVGAFGSRGGDKASTTGGADERLSDMATKADQESAGGSPGEAPPSTIGSVFTGGDVAVAIDSPEDLRALAPPTDGDSTYSVPGDTLVPITSTVEMTAAPTAMRPALDCLTEQQVFLADIVYDGQYAIAARDTGTGVTVAIDDECNVLASVNP